VTAARVVLKRGRARPLWARNPSVYASSVDRTEGDVAPGAVVDVVDHRGKFVARGLHHGDVSVPVTAWTWDPSRAIDDDLLRERVEAAVRFRRNVLRLPGEGTDAYRLVHGAGDRMPGLVVDRYDHWLAVRLGSAGLASRRETLGRLLLEATGARGAWAGREPSLRTAGLTGEPGLLAGEEPPDGIPFLENGLRFATRFGRGPKTGHFLDQRENRRRVADLAAGRRVLDVFCSSGGFALAAGVLGGAREVVAIDESEDALDLARRNAEANGATAIEWVRADAFRDLRRREAEGERYGLVVLDPPAFARTAREKEAALRGYREINLRALGLLEPGGLLVTCSCSSPVTAADLRLVLREAGMDRGLDVVVFETRGQAPDHPVLAAAPEGSYLKALFAVVGG
jgi:23S rRNA (cytosine1962-C5)-methyltransferase